LAQSGDTICAVATPPGEGAVGVVRLSGPRAREIVELACPEVKLRPRRLQATTVHRGREVLDRVLVCLMPGPRSYTGEDVVEIHAHGGTLNLERILGLFIEHGARVASPGEFTRRAFLNGRIDLTQAEAVAQVIAARSERALRNAQAVLGGALGRRIGALRQDLVELCARLESEIDFADEDPAGPEVERSVERRHDDLEREIAQLSESYEERGRPGEATVALTGPTNVGKSSLFNRLLQTTRALVSPRPGTTRDYLEAEVRWGGQRITLVDTAGERGVEEQSALEHAGRELAAPVIARCDLRVHVLDLSLPWPADLGAGIATIGTPVVIAANKLDLSEEPAERIEAERGDGVKVVATSALTGEGVERLREAVLELLSAGRGETEAETVQIVLERHHAALCRARRAVVEGRAALREGRPPEIVVEHAREALFRLGEITGEHFAEDVLDAVFSRFCIGK